MMKKINNNITVKIKDISKRRVNVGLLLAMLAAVLSADIQNINKYRGLININYRTN